jgi:hypothetical protein
VADYGKAIIRQPVCGNVLEAHISAVLSGAAWSGKVEFEARQQPQQLLSTWVSLTLGRND